jgi:hypothetical protein
MFKLIAAAFTLFYLSSAFAAERVNLMIVGNDSDENSVIAASRVFKSVTINLADQMHTAGFNVYDEAAVIEHGYFDVENSRNDRDLIALVRTVKRPPIDVIVLFELSNRVDETRHSRKVIASIQGRMLHVRTGQFLGNFETNSSGNWFLQTHCNQQCKLEEERRYSQILANDLGAVLAEKLSCLVNSNCDAIDNHDQLIAAYELQFIGFEQSSISNIEKQLMDFKGYYTHRPSEIRPEKSVMWYESQLGSAELHQQLATLMGKHYTNAQVKFSGNIFQVRIPREPVKPVLREIEDKTKW